MTVGTVVTLETAAVPPAVTVGTAVTVVPAMTVGTTVTLRQLCQQ